ncbi:MAG: dTDP-4-dehydrorhamnose 3,5-epimerase family protein [Actinobacteria bacterium]|nr:dTDP-4-dehydrorhamnose 3,5-epimerase family protein [Actinomycetota bacterium]
MSVKTDGSSVAIDGVRVVDLVAHADDRGALTELYRREWFPNGPEMVQANLSESSAGVLRGLHFHRRQTDYWVVLEGVAFIGLFDLRLGSPTRGRSGHLRLDAAEGLRGLLIPPGVAHGFFAVSPLRLQYLVDLAFDGSDEHGVAWNDPALGIPWPEAEPVLSGRDRSNPSLEEVLRDPPAVPRQAPRTKPNLG